MKSVQEKVVEEGRKKEHPWGIKYRYMIRSLYYGYMDQLKNHGMRTNMITGAYKIVHRLDNIR